MGVAPVVPAFAGTSPKTPRDGSQTAPTPAHPELVEGLGKTRKGACLLANPLPYRAITHYNKNHQPARRPNMTAPQEKEPPNWQDRIVKNPQILAGKPIIKGTRISVELVTDFLDGGVWTIEDVLKEYSHITREDIDACIRYKATGAKLSNFTWADLEALSDETDRSRGRSS